MAAEKSITIFWQTNPQKHILSIIKNIPWYKNMLKRIHDIVYAKKHVRSKLFTRFFEGQNFNTSFDTTNRSQNLKRHLAIRFWACQYSYTFSHCSVLINLHHLQPIRLENFLIHFISIHNDFFRWQIIH